MKDYTADDARHVRDWAIDNIETTTDQLGIRHRPDIRLSDAINALEKNDTVNEACVFLLCLKLPNALLHGNMVSYAK